MQILRSFEIFTGAEKRNIAIYVIGIMFYKFGLEAFNGSIATLAQDRFNATHTFTKWGVLTGLNQAMQCVGSIIIAPLIRRYPTRTVLSLAILAFGLLTTVLLILDRATGGRIKTNGQVHYGTYNPDILFPIYTLSGVAYGMVELIRRIIPRDIVGGHIVKLKRMDAMVHVLYEVSGTAGAFASAALITRLGNNYSFCVTPVCFILSAMAWRMLDPLNFLPPNAFEERHGYATQLWHGFKHFGTAVYAGAYITTRHRKFIWLIPGYSLAFYGHRFLENGIAPIIAKRVLEVSTYSQIIVGGSNLGELLGAFTVFVLANRVHTPIPFIRADAILLNILWFLPFYVTRPREVSYAWKIAACFIPISFGWAAGDVSLAAYIQASLSRVESRNAGISALGAVMAFLYVIYIVMNAIMSAVLGSYVDNQWNKHQNIYPALRNIGPVQFSIIAGFIFIATLIPKGSFLLNPDLLDEEVPDVEFSDFTTTHSEGNSRVDAEGSIKSGFRQSLDFSETEHRRRSAEVNMFVAEEDDR